MISTPTGRAVTAWLVLVVCIGLTTTTLLDDARRDDALSTGRWLAGQLGALAGSAPSSERPLTQRE